MRTNIKSKVGHRLKEIRNKENISQEVLESRSGINRTFISHIVNGRRNASIDTIEKLIKGLSISVQFFFNDPIFK